jgi:hypothetical protein
MKKTLVMLLMLALTGAAFGQSQQEMDYADLQAVKETARHVSKFNLTCHRNVDCHVLPMGEMACGGPSEYLIASTVNPRFEVISHLAKISIELERQYNLNYEVVSTCIAIEPPRVRCVRRKCR